MFLDFDLKKALTLVKNQKLLSAENILISANSLEKDPNDTNKQANNNINKCIYIIHIYEKKDFKECFSKVKYDLYQFLIAAFHSLKTPVCPISAQTAYARSQLNNCQIHVHIVQPPKMVAIWQLFWL